MQEADSHLVMSGDCGGTNTRLVLFRVSDRKYQHCGQPPEGEVIYSKKYLNSEQKSFTDVCKLFLEEAGGFLPMACCLACAGAITADQKERSCALTR
jgi:glucokinase